MKKLFFALMAVCAITFGFTSCDQADPAKEPIAGKQYTGTDATGYVEFQFHMNHTMTSISVIAGETIQSSNFKWSMDNPNITIQSVGKVVYTGVYHADASSITITEKITGQDVTFVLTQKGK